MTGLYYDCYIAIIETIELCAKKKSLFKYVINKMCLQIIFNMYV